MSKPKLVDVKPIEDLKPEPIVPAEEPVERRAFSVQRVGGAWSFVTIFYLDYGDWSEIVDVKMTTPDIKAVTVEHFKLAAFRYWSTLG